VCVALWEPEPDPVIRGRNLVYSWVGIVWLRDPDEVEIKAEKQGCSLVVAENGVLEGVGLEDTTEKR